uniref:ARF7 effector protein C-terminal domain-containing protein n=1 Tax=Panagrolaimus davidi TaxID=227884 RepID=A0A914QE90_9BILA
MDDDSVSQDASQKIELHISKPKTQFARKGTGGIAPIYAEEVKMTKVQRTYEQLSFSNPGKQFADIGLDFRGGRRREVAEKQRTKKVKPHYDGKGCFVHPEFKEPIKMCDCLRQDCPGCFPKCRKCTSKFCGPICQINRNTIPIQISVNGLGGLIRNNPLVNEKGKKKKQKVSNEEEEDEDDQEYSQPSTEEEEETDDPNFDPKDPDFTPLVFGMIHVPALPGTPKSKLSLNAIDEIVKDEAEIYKKCGVDGIILENMHDLPYSMSKDVGPEIVAAMTRFSISAAKIFKSSKLPSLMGIQILAGANCQALSVAAAAELDFIRAECFVFAHVADEGFMQGNAAKLMRFRRNICAENIAVITDIKKKHSSHAITADVSIGEMAHAAEFFLGDGVILTGNATGQPANVHDIKGYGKKKKKYKH